MNKNCVVLYSGGMDSTVVLHHAINYFENIIALTFDYGQRHSVELGTARKYLDDLNEPRIKHINLNIKDIGINLISSALTNKEISVPNVKDVLGDPQTVTYVPNRNMMFLSIAAAFAESQNASTILYGAAQADDTSGYWDCTESFRSLMDSILSLNRRNTIKIEAPLINLNKKEIIEMGIKYNVNFKQTHTCYNPNPYGKFKFMPQACGVCTSCSARIAGFINAGYVDPVKYSKEIPWKDFNLKTL